MEDPFATNNHSSAAAVAPPGAPASSSAAASAAATSSSSSDASSISSAVLETRLRQLRDQSHAVSQSLTQKLASSQSGQNLLHIGPSLSTLPPDLHTLLDALRPLLVDVESYESTSRAELGRIVAGGNEIRTAKRRAEEAADCAEMYGDLIAAERDVRRDGERRRAELGSGGRGGGGRSAGASDSGGGGGKSRRRSDDAGGEGAAAGTDEFWDEAEKDEDDLDELDHVASLERSAHTTLYLVQQLRASTAKMSELTSGGGGGGGQQNPASSTAAASAAAAAEESGAAPTALPSMRAPLPDDTEKARFLMKLAPRIRRLESDAVRSLTARLEGVLEETKRRKAEAAAAKEDGADEPGGGGGRGGGTTTEAEAEAEAAAAAEGRELLMVGHCLRGLALLGRGREAESAFARVAIMPLIRTKVSMGRLDEGGSRGECAGLFSLLDDMACSIAGTFGGVLRLSESMFDVSEEGGEGVNGVGEGIDGATTSSAASVEVDLVTAGVWIPIATALMADPAVKMNIFSPGIASILQANYSALDTFVSELASSLLRPQSSSSDDDAARTTTTARDAAGHLDDVDDEYSELYYRPSLPPRLVRAAQSRIYRHPMTADFEKKWNLPIYYQLRFGDCTARLDEALGRTRREGWAADVFAGEEAEAARMRERHGFELPLFLELYDCLLWLWRPDVVVRPLAHRFLRGAVQIVGRALAFARDGLEGKVRFGEVVEVPVRKPSADENGDSLSSSPARTTKTDNTYCWGDRIEDVASVAWDLTVLETCLSGAYADVVSEAIAPPDAATRSYIHNSSPSELDELRSSSRDVLSDAALDVAPLVDRCWNDVIASSLTVRCRAPLSAVRGVAATYRMTNRPPPSQASPFVATVLRPLTEFDAAFASRTPPRVGDGWKVSVASAVSDAYASAVEELLSTVERTEMALKSRKTAARRGGAAGSGGMSDGEKVRLQLYLDQAEFARRVAEAGVDGTKVAGLSRLASLTKSAEALYLQSRRQNGR